MPPIPHEDLGRVFLLIDAWPSGITAGSDRVSSRPDFQQNLLAHLFRVSECSLRSHLKFQVCIHEGRLRTCETGS